VTFGDKYQNIFFSASSSAICYGELFKKDYSSLKGQKQILIGLLHLKKKSLNYILPIGEAAPPVKGRENTQTGRWRACDRIDRTSTT
jgi:hypothetical protein